MNVFGTLHYQIFIAAHIHLSRSTNLAVVEIMPQIITDIINFVFLRITMTALTSAHSHPVVELLAIFLAAWIMWMKSREFPAKASVHGDGTGLN